MLFSAVASSNSLPARMHLELSSRTTQSSLPLILQLCQSRCTAVKLCSRSYLIQAFLRFFLFLLSFAKPCSRRTLWILLWGIWIPCSNSMIFSRRLAPNFCFLWVSSINSTDSSSSSCDFLPNFLMGSSSRFFHPIHLDSLHSRFAHFHFKRDKLSAYVVGFSSNNVFDLLIS